MPVCTNLITPRVAWMEFNKIQTSVLNKRNPGLRLRLHPGYDCYYTNFFAFSSSQTLISDW